MCSVLVVMLIMCFMVDVGFVLCMGIGYSICMVVVFLMVDVIEVGFVRLVIVML